MMSKAALLSKFAKLLFCLTTAVFVLLPFVGSEQAMVPSVLVTGGFWGLYAGAWYCAVRGWYPIGGHILIWGWWILQICVLVLSAELFTMSLASAVNVVVIAGFTMGRTEALKIGLTMVLTLTVFSIARSFGLLPHAFIELTEFVRVMTLMATLVVTTGLVYVGITHFDDVASLAQSRMVQIQEANEALMSARETEGRRAYRAERLGMMTRSLLELKDVKAIVSEVVVSLRDVLAVPVVFVLGRDGQVLAIAGIGDREPPQHLLREHIERLVPLGESCVLEPDIVKQLAEELSAEIGSAGLAARGSNTGLTIVAVSGAGETLGAGEGIWSVQAAVNIMDVSIMRYESERRFVQSQQMDALGRLSAGIAHDFNNLLTTIMGCTELVEHSVSGESPIHGHLKRIREAGERAELLTSKLMTFTHGATQPRQALEIGGFISNLVPIIRRTLEESIRLEYLEFDREVWVEAASDDLERILFNLVANARDAVGGSGRIDVGIDVRQDQAVGGGATGVAVIWVQDNGEGMDSVTRSRMFEPFFTMRKGKGATGLGLSIVASVVQASGGEVFIDSSEDTGTCVEIHLPEVDGPSVGQEPVPRELDKTGQLVLVVEDDSDVRETLCEMLDLLGYRVESVGTGMEALATLGSTDRFSVVLSDIVMPEMGGFELATKMAAEGIEVPIVLISGYAPGEEVAQDMAKDFPRLSKPFSLGQLQSVIANNTVG